MGNKNNNYVFGKKAVIEAISNNQVIKVYTLKKNVSSLGLLNESLLEIVNKNFFLEFPNVNHQFYIAKIKLNYDPNNSNLEVFWENIKTKNKKKSIIVILDEIQDPGNFGSICRTSECFGIDGLIYKKNNQVQINQTVIKTSVGAVFNLNMLKTTNINNVLEFLKKQGYWIISSSLSNESVFLNEFKTNIEKIVLIVGNEEKGISNLIQKKSDIVLKIKMEGTSQSLNASISTAIFLHYLNNL